MKGKHRTPRYAVRLVGLIVLAGTIFRRITILCAGRFKRPEGSNLYINDF